MDHLGIIEEFVFQPISSVFFVIKKNHSQLLWGKDFEHGWCISLLSGSYLEPQNPQTSPGPVVLHCQNCFARQGSNESCFVALFWMGWLLSTITALCVWVILMQYIIHIHMWHFDFLIHSKKVKHFILPHISISYISHEMFCNRFQRHVLSSVFFLNKSDISRWSLWSPKQQHVFMEFWCLIRCFGSSRWLFHLFFAFSVQKRSMASLGALESRSNVVVLFRTIFPMHFEDLKRDVESIRLRLGFEKKNLLRQCWYLH